MESYSAVDDAASDRSKSETLGCALGPDWVDSLTGCGKKSVSELIILTQFHNKTVLDKCRT